MKPMMMPTTTTVLGAPRDWNKDKHGPCEGLPVTESEGCLYSYWKLTWKERLAVLVGKPVRLCVASLAHPAVALEVTGD